MCQQEQKKVGIYIYVCLSVCFWYSCPMAIVNWLIPINGSWFHAPNVSTMGSVHFFTWMDVTPFKRLGIIMSSPWMVNIDIGLIFSTADLGNWQVLLWSDISFHMANWLIPIHAPNVHTMQIPFKTDVLLGSFQPSRDNHVLSIYILPQECYPMLLRYIFPFSFQCIVMNASFFPQHCFTFSTLTVLLIDFFAIFFIESNWHVK